MKAVVVFKKHNNIKELITKITNFKKYSLYLNGFLKKSASQLAQNRSSHSLAMAGTMFAQSVLLNFSRNPIPFMKHPG